MIELFSILFGVDNNTAQLGYLCFIAGGISGTIYAFNKYFNR